MRITLLGVTAALVLASGAIAATTPRPAAAAPLTSAVSSMPLWLGTIQAPHGAHLRQPIKQHLSKGVSRAHHATARSAARTAAGVTAPKAEMLALINAERAQAGDGPLAFDGTLNAIAQGRSQDMITRHYFAHEIPGVPGVHMVFDILDHDNVQYQMAGENIALNNYIDFYSMTKTVQQTNTDLMNSPEHKANILEPKYTRIGIGMAFEQGTGKLILTEVFVQP